MITNELGSWVRWPVLLLVLVGGASAASAQRSALVSDLPVFGVGARQIFRFAVANAADQGRVEDAGRRCQATLSFRDTLNRPIGSSKIVDLGPNEATFHDLDTRTLGLRARQRIDFRPVLSPAPDSAPCLAAFSVLDALTGRLWTQGGPALIWTSEPGCLALDQIFGHYLPSIGWGQTLQVTVVRSTNPVDVNNAPLPCDVTVNIYGGGSATPVASLVTGALAPGQAAAVPIPFNMLGLAFGETANLHLDVLSLPVDIQFPGIEETCSGSTNCGCTLSTQVIDNLTQWTTVIWVP